MTLVCMHSMFFYEKSHTRSCSRPRILSSLTSKYNNDQNQFCWKHCAFNTLIIIIILRQFFSFATKASSQEGSPKCTCNRQYHQLPTCTYISFRRISAWDNRSNQSLDLKSFQQPSQVKPPISSPILAKTKEIGEIKFDLSLIFWLIYSTNISFN